MAISEMVVRDAIRIGSTVGLGANVEALGYPVDT